MRSVTSGGLADLVGDEIAAHESRLDADTRHVRRGPPPMRNGAAARRDAGLAQRARVSRLRAADSGCDRGAALAPERRVLVDMLDSDTVALEAAREERPGGAPGVRHAPRRCRMQGYAAILANPRCTRAATEDTHCSTAW